MAKVVHFDNPFEPIFQRRTYEHRRPTTVQRLLKQLPELRRHTSVRRIRERGDRRVRDFVRPTVCQINGRPLLRKDWSRTVVKPADVVSFHELVEGGGNGGKNPLGIVLAVAVAIAVPFIGAWLGPIVAGALAISQAAGIAIATAAASIVLGAAASGIMSLFSGPPPSPYEGGYQTASLAPSGTTQSSPTYSLGAQGNSARLGQPIPELTGRHQVYPDFAMLPYSRYVDNEQYVHSCLVVSRGFVDIEAPRIGDTPVSSFEEIVWEKVEPGASGDPDICDPRWLPCRDLATVLLPPSGEGSPWKGPFASNPPNTIVDLFEVDFVTPGGLFKYNSSAGFDSRSVVVELEAQKIAADGTPIDGVWSLIDTVTITEATQTEQRRTYTKYFPTPGRWQVRCRRTNAKDTDTNARNDVQWVGLRGRLTSERRFDGVTTMRVRMKATGDLNNQTSRQVNVIATRKLPTWDFELGRMTESLVATRCPCDAFAHIARTWVPDENIDLAGIYAHKAAFTADGWTFDYVWDQAGLPAREALMRVARAVVGVEVEQGSKVCLILDRPNSAPAMAFTPRNIRLGTFNVKWKLPDDTTADGVSGSYVDVNTWKPITVVVANDDSPQRNVVKIGTEGITNRQQLRAVLYNRHRGNQLRRSAVSWGTDTEGLTLLYGDSVALTHDMPAWGQSAEVLAWNPVARTMTLSDALSFEPGATHYVAIRDSQGMAIGPFLATNGGERKLVIGPGDLPPILTGGDAERTFIQFGKGEEYAARLKVILLDPQDDKRCDIIACDDDPGMYAPLPEEAEEPPPVGAPVDPLDIHVSSNTSTLNLRSRANAHGWSGNPAQAVTITIDPGVHVVSVVRGTWPAGFQPTLVNKGTISGADGAPGAGGLGGSGATGGLMAFSGSPGGAGGPALDARSGPLKFDNSVGTIRGGRGGGGGGGGGGGSYHETMEMSGDIPIMVGHPMDGGAGGDGNGGVGAVGMTDGTATGGTGGTGGALGAYAGTGGAGGTGSDGSGGTTNYGGANGGAGGPGGAAVTGNANITWLGATGTIIGAVL